MNVKLISSKETYNLRHIVLWPHKPIDKCFIDIDDSGYHFGFFQNNQLVSIGSFFEINNESFPSNLIQFRLRAMASSSKGIGAGSLLINSAINYLKINEKANIIWCDARKAAVGFYEKNGFKILKGPYEIPIIGTHYLMYKKL